LLPQPTPSPPLAARPVYRVRLATTLPFPLDKPEEEEEEIEGDDNTHPCAKWKAA